MAKLTDEEKKALKTVEGSTAVSKEFSNKWNIKSESYRDRDFGGDEDAVDEKAKSTVKQLRKDGWKVKKSCRYSQFANTYMCTVSAVKKRGM